MIWECLWRGSCSDTCRQMAGFLSTILGIARCHRHSCIASKGDWGNLFCHSVWSHHLGDAYQCTDILYYVCSAWILFLKNLQAEDQSCTRQRLTSFWVDPLRFHRYSARGEH